MVYFDNSSTTKQCKASLDAMVNCITNDFANASSLHTVGVNAKAHIDSLKKNIASAILCTPNEIYIASGGTYCNNLAIAGVADAYKRRGNKIVISSIEHPSVTECAKTLSEKGFEVVMCNPLTNDFENAIDEKTILVSCMLVNNETGLILPVDKLKQIIKQKGSQAILHIDAVQAFGKLPINVQKLGADLLTVSAHKINGPKGIGALYIKKGVRVNAITYGGEQEGSLIPGTYNTPAIAGFNAAICEILKQDKSHLDSLYKYFVKKSEQFDFLKLNTFGNHAPHIINLSFMGYLGENVLHFLESKNIFVSQGSACSSHSKQKAKTLISLGCDKKVADGSIRVSFDFNNTTDEIDEFFDAVSYVPQQLIKLYK